MASGSKRGACARADARSTTSALSQATAGARRVVEPYSPMVRTLERQRPASSSQIDQRSSLSLLLSLKSTTTHTRHDVRRRRACEQLLTGWRPHFSIPPGQTIKKCGSIFILHMLQESFLIDDEMWHCRLLPSVVAFNSYATGGKFCPQGSYG